MTRIVDRTGEKYGRWTVLHRANNRRGKVMWWCRCECENEKAIYGGSLHRGLSKSCGCLNKDRCYPAPVDHTGKRFGRWTVIKIDQKSRGAAIKWFCRCDCGTYRSLQASGLVNGRSQSCGCWGREIRPQKYRKRPFHVAYKVVQKRAKKKNIECLSYEEFLEFTKIDMCHYCGCHVIWTPHTRKYNKKALGGHGELGGWRTYLDRIDSSLGYTPDNIMVACVKCNVGKNTDSYNDYLSRCRAVALRHPNVEPLLKVL